ncbi:hypothetical protein GpartN1_g5505.t1 [Galdieria partita]|uniref:CCD97-like C-terminal domain-containing protein n=1 Tax=Galdieria partita TaxID=83374 RepID=A0A9C7Q0U5_9RHOD|nr:hypothetical protein GpartN1_g5505.t1 [Galdieria partita]
MDNKSELLEAVVQRLVNELCEEGHSECTLEQLRTCMSHNPAYFLHRYGFFITEAERESLFGELAEKDWLVRTELWRLRKQRGDSCCSQDKVVRNRRLAAFEHLVLRGQYFSDEQMELRDPLLYYRLWGRYASYLNTSELEQIRNNDASIFSYRARASDETISCEREQTVRNTIDEEATVRPLTDYLMEYFDAKDIVVKRMQQRRKERGGSVSNTKRRLLRSSSFGQMKEDIETEYINEQLIEQTSDEENESDISSWTLDDFQQSREELLITLRHRFLNGEDGAFFDYSTVDNNEQYDDWVDWIQKDIEERYFDAQEPERIFTMEEDNQSTTEE